MGGIWSRQNVRVEEVDFAANCAYRYPPKTGNYFASHFIMGGERFDANQPEAYLFGENTDLNFLGGKPTPFPYPAPQANEPTRPLRSLVNIRKESLRFVRIQDESKADDEVTDVVPPCRYNIEFTFDTDVRCAITIHYFCTEEITSNGLIYSPRNAEMSSETYHYKRGANQQFSQSSHIFDPSLYCEEELTYNFEDEILPVVIHCLAEEGDEPRQSHVLVAVVEKNSDNTYTLKPLKQKLFVDGLCYLLQEIYGIENKNVAQTKPPTGDEETEDSGAECVICMCDSRDTLILPCRHLCLCSCCADSLRYQANNCPICRAPFRALLQVRAVRRTLSSAVAVPHLGGSAGDAQTCQDIPPGYEVVPLVEALNGPVVSSAPAAAMHLTVGLPPEAGTPEGPAAAKPRRSGRRRSGSTSSLQTDSAGAVAPPEVVVAAVVSSDPEKGRAVSPLGPDVRWHRRSSSRAAPEQVRLLSESSEGSASRRKENLLLGKLVRQERRRIQAHNEHRRTQLRGREAEAAETRSLLEGNGGGESRSQAATSPSVHGKVSASTPHSLHLCQARPDKENKATDTSPGAEDSDYYTPEDPAVQEGGHFLVDQGTDTSLDTPLAETPSAESSSGTAVPTPSSGSNSAKNSPDAMALRRRRAFDDRCSPVHEEERPIELVEVKKATTPLAPTGTTTTFEARTQTTSPSRPSASSSVGHAETSISLPGTPASNASNRSSGDSCSSGSSTRLLLSGRHTSSQPPSKTTGGSVD
ncbi:mahogunin ring finger 1 isoform X2 [Dermacentor variabilis]|uniref:mahogunin ring finger 1 isoform X2 n=1 Tax=Dermacentor variabilis TaxID=34621 RepID=UPI003F5AE223